MPLLLEGTFFLGIGILFLFGPWLLRHSQTGGSLWRVLNAMFSVSLRRSDPTRNGFEFKRITVGWAACIIGAAELFAFVYYRFLAGSKSCCGLSISSDIRIISETRVHTWLWIPVFVAYWAVTASWMLRGGWIGTTWRQRVVHLVAVVALILLATIVEGVGSLPTYLFFTLMIILFDVIGRKKW